MSDRSVPITSSASISSPAGSPASRSRKQDRVELRPTFDGSGLSSHESFASYDRATCSWRTSQVSWLEEWVTFSGTWPRRGMTRRGLAFALPTSARRMSDSASSLWATPMASTNRKSRRAMTSSGAGSGNGRRSGGGQSSPPGLEQQAELEQGMTPREFWPTPMASDAEGSRSSKGRDRPSEGGLQNAALHWPTPTESDGDSTARHTTEAEASHEGTTLTDAVRLWPTPTARDRNTYAKVKRGANAMAGGTPLVIAVSPDEPPRGQLNPDWVECLMGFPIGWTRTAGLHRRARASGSGNRRGSRSGSRTGRGDSEDSETP